MPEMRSIDVHDPRIRASIDNYWRQNLRIMGVLLAIWAAVGLGCGVLLGMLLNFGITIVLTPFFPAPSEAVRDMIENIHEPEDAGRAVVIDAG